MKIAIFFLLLFCADCMRFEKNYRFSNLQSIYYSSYQEISLNLSCAIFQFTPVTDISLLYEISSTTSSLLTLYKGEMQWMPEIDIMNCFVLEPSVLGVRSFCIREIGIPSNSYLILTNTLGDFAYGLVNTPRYEQILFSRMMFYNTSIIDKPDCGFQPLLL